MSTTLSLAGVPLDLSPDTAILPTFQVSDLLQPQAIQSDFSPEFAVPDTAKNAQLLGHAAYDGPAAKLPYRSLAGVNLRSEGVELMPRARLFVKGYEAGAYQLQLFAGNRRFVEALGEKTLRELDFSRFDHLWTLDNIAPRAAPDHWAANGWGYELFDRGRPVNLAVLSPYELYPTLTASLIWQQLLKQAGFAASDWQSPVLDALQLPAVKEASINEDFRTARRLRVGLGPGHEESGNEASDRADVVKPIPFDDDRRPIGNVPPIVPTVGGIYRKKTVSGTRGLVGVYVADQALYVQVLARTVVQITYSSVRLGRAQARVELHVNGQRVVRGENLVAQTEDPYLVSVNAESLLLQPGDELSAVLVLSGVGSAPVDKWGFRIFRDAVFSNVPVDKLEVTVLERLPPGGQVHLSDWLPDLKQLDFFKTLVQLGGLSVQCDPYEDYLFLAPSRRILDNAPEARDWTAKRDTPTAPAGQARKVAYRYGHFGQRNHFRYAEDPTVQQGYGDGSFLLDDTNLPLDYELLRLPFAATERSQDVPALLKIAAYKLRENEDPFAEPEYERVTAKPRLTLSTDRVVVVTLSETTQVNGQPVTQTRAGVRVPVSHFSDPDEPVSLDAQAYLLPVNWAGLRALLTECRYHTERYRLSPRDLADFVANPNRPVWDGVLQGYFSVSKIVEYTSRRPVEVELLRLHPSFLIAPTPPLESEGEEWYEKEFYVGLATRGEFL
jgi:hypothetical protein